MSTRREMELCPNWSGDGDACPCAALGLDRAEARCPVHPAGVTCVLDKASSS